MIMNLSEAKVYIDDFEDSETKRTGTDRKRKRLKSSSVPSRFPDYPGYYADVPVTQPRMTQAATNGARHLRRVQAHHQRELDMMANDDVPQVDFCVNVYQDMTFKAFASGLYTNPDKFKDCIAKIGIIGKLSELQNVLACLKCTEFTPQDSLTHCNLTYKSWMTKYGS